MHYTSATTSTSRACDTNYQTVQPKPATHLVSGTYALWLHLKDVGAVQGRH